MHRVCVVIKAEKPVRVLVKILQSPKVQEKRTFFLFLNCKNVHIDNDNNSENDIINYCNDNNDREEIIMKKVVIIIIIIISEFDARSAALH